MNNKKATGSFYTPKLLTEYMVNYAVQKKQIRNVLEPSMGDGRFIDTLSKYEFSIKGIEIDKAKVDKCKNINSKITFESTDFITYAIENDEKYDLIIGNPPYIAKKKFSKKEREKQLKITKYWDLPTTVFQNIWVSFVLASMKLLADDGAIFFVLPFEFLQVQYAEKLRNFLEKKFSYIEIITFEEKVFPEIEQDVCLVYLTNMRSKKSVIHYKTVNNYSEMKQTNHSKIHRHKPLQKWSNSILDDKETDLLIKYADKYTKVSELGFSSPGIVTGANDFFVISKNKAKDLKCEEKSLPIILKGASLPNLLIFKQSDMIEIERLNKPTRLLNLSQINKQTFSKSLQLYLNNAVDKNNLPIAERYKCRKRKRWYDVPIIPKGDLLFFKRFNLLPKLIMNKADVYTTDIAYNVRLKDDFDPASVVFCFYNSLTLALCEYNGRFYGGGVNELVPSEFKALAVPYQKIEKKQLKILDTMFRENASTESIINFVDDIVFSSVKKQDIKALKEIRNKYLKRRLNINLD